ncbi:MAG: hypothetical protein KA419_17915 [Acidobacteria bacterium]|nr:hypothetical protein [Acidobacteriota bacterium]
MAANFRILARQDHGEVCVSLAGDFDGSSACELVNFLQDTAPGHPHLTVDTRGLGVVHPFGVQVFQNRRGMLNPSAPRIALTGRHAETLWPEAATKRPRRPSPGIHRHSRALAR